MPAPSNDEKLEVMKKHINLAVAEKGEIACTISGESLGITRLNELIKQTLTELGYKVDEVANTYYTDYNSYSLKISW